MRMIHRGYVYESTGSSTGVWYHGSSSDFSQFSVDHAYIEDKSTAQYGPGFYLTPSLEEAIGYAGENGYVKEVKISNLRKIKKASSRSNSSIAISAVNNLPPDREDDILSNWGQNKDRAKRELMNAMMERPNLGDQMQSIWIDCFRYAEPQFCVFASKFMDGLWFERNGTPCIVGYNPSRLPIVRNIPVSELK